MRLSAFNSSGLGPVLEVLERALHHHPWALAAFRRVAATWALAPSLETDLFAGHDAAVRLGRRLGIPLLDANPADGFSWDGHAVATQTETAVLLHEYAHWQVAPESRHSLPDFGLGAGPETGRKVEADGVCCVTAETKEREEDLASLLGILWEAKLGGPAIIAFCEQNWLELYDRPGTARHFIRVFEDLRGRGLVDATGVPRASVAAIA